MARHLPRGRRPGPSRWAIAAAALASSALIARAQDVAPRTELAARVEHYVDADHTSVVRPRASAIVPAGERAEILATYMMDGVSSASIDVVTRATQGIREERHDASLGATLLGERAGTLGLTYGYGHEPDYQTHALTVTGGRDVDAARMLHANGRLQLAENRIGAVGDPRFERRLGVYTASGGLARIVDEATVVRASLDLSHAHGFQSSAYRTVRIGDWTAARYTGTDPDAGAWVFSNVIGTARERHPDDRFRARLALDGARAFGRHASALAAVAAYVDSWRIAAGDFGGELRYEPIPHLLLRLGARAYVQSSAYFYRSRYVTVQEAGGYVSDDKELGRLRSYSLLAAGSFPVGSMRIDVRVEGTRYEYPDFVLLSGKLAIATQIGLVWRR